MPRSAFALALALAACSPEPPNDVAADDAAVDSGAADSNDACVGQTKWFGLPCLGLRGWFGAS